VLRSRIIRRGAQPSEHRPGIVRAQRRDAQRDVLQRLDKDASQTNGHGGSEVRIARHSQDDLLVSAADHFLNEHAPNLGARIIPPRVFDDPGERDAD